MIDLQPQYNIWDAGFSKLLTKESSLLDAQDLGLPSYLSSIFSGDNNPQNLASGEWIGNVSIKDGYLQSSNFVTGSTGWRIDKDGNIEANNGVFRGSITGATGIFSGSITIGTGNNIFKADSNGIYLGNATFASAPFRVSMVGALIATSATITNGVITGGTIQTATSGQRIVVEGSDNTLRFYDANGQIIGIGSTAGTAIRIDDSATTGSGVAFYSSVAGTGFRYENDANVTGYGLIITLTGATNDGMGIRIDNDGTGYGMFLDITNTAKGIYLQSTSSGDLLSLVGTGTGKPLYVSQSTGSATAILLEQNGQGIGFDLEDSGTGSNPVVKIVNSRAGESLFIDRNISGYALYIDQDVANNSSCNGAVIEITQNGTNTVVGLEMALANAGAGLEYAFNFRGSEKGITEVGNGGFVSNNTGTFTAVGYIRIAIEGSGPYYIPYGTIA